jgi:hypothetical protein
MKRTSGNTRALPHYARKEFETTTNDPSRIFVSAKGRKYGSWIDATDRSNSFNANDLIENPAYIIESILRDGLGKSSTDIRVASFDAAGTVYGTGYDTAFSWYEPQPVFEKIGAICDDVGALFLADHNLQFRLIALNQASYDFRLVEADFLGNDNFVVNKTSADLIANELIVKYKYNYATNAYDETVTYTADYSNFAGYAEDDRTLAGGYDVDYRDGYTTYSGMLNASKTKYNITKLLTYEAPHIRELSVAKKVFKRLANWHALQRVIIDADLPLKKLDSDSNHTTADIEVGDYCLINHTLLPTTTCGISGTTDMSNNALFVVTRYIFNPVTLTVHLTLRETPYWDTP